MEDEAIASHVQEHFASVELGWQATSEQLVQKYHESPVLLADTVDRDPRAVPSLYDTEALLGRLSSGRVPGTDGFRGGFWAYRPEASRQAAAPGYGQSFLCRSGTHFL